MLFVQKIILEWKIKVQDFFGLLKIENSKYYIYEDSTSFLHCFMIITGNYNGDFSWIPDIPVLDSSITLISKLKQKKERSDLLVYWCWTTCSWSSKM